MKIVYSWLKDYIKTELPAEELAQRLTMAGFEVESVEQLGQGLAGVVTGRIVNIAPHPNADRLVVTQVDCGTQTYTIVTAAKNIAVGHIVPVSLPGAVLAGGMRIQKSKLRGVASHGMLCSQVELGTASESEGIWILPGDTPLGVDAVTWLGLRDAVLDVSVLPNRGDCMSYIGLAREVAALVGSELLFPPAPLSLIADQKVLTVAIGSPSCTAYLGRRISGVVIGESPLWMQRRLTLSGLRPVNTVVDVTNYVMLETGQPLHAFDAEKLHEQINIDTLAAPESCLLLDGKTHTVPAGALAIRSGGRTCAVAGVMGSAESSVTTDTTTLVLESAAFEGSAVRKTARALGIRTESAARFERHIDPAMVGFANDRAAGLITQLSGGTTSSAAVGTLPTISPGQLSLDVTRLNHLLGTTFSRDTITDTLGRLGFVCQGDVVMVPTWRNRDIAQSADLAEEVARTIGFEAIPAKLPDAGPVLPPPDRLRRLRDIGARHLVSTGFAEIKTYPLVQKTGSEPPHLTLANPISDALGVLRTSLLPGLLQTASHNIKRQVSDLRLFEIGKVFPHDPSDTEHWHVGGLVVGRWYPDAYTSPWSLPLNLDGIASLVLSLLHHLKTQINGQPSPSSDPLLHPGQSLSWRHGDKIVGEYGMIHPSHAQVADLPVALGLFFLDLSALSTQTETLPEFQSISKFPSIRRDVALSVPRTLTFESVMSALDTHRDPTVTDIRLFDRFASDKLGTAVYSLAFAITYQAPDRTLTDDEVSAAHQRLIDAVCQALPVTLRT